METTEHDTLAAYWTVLREQAYEVYTREPHLAELITKRLLGQPDLHAALAALVSTTLACDDREAAKLEGRFQSLLVNEDDLCVSALYDLDAVVNQDPAFETHLEVFLFSKGFTALQAYRLGHALLRSGHRYLALYLQSRSNTVLGIDIHPACRIGKSIMLDHGTGIVIGETAVVEDQVSILQGVTLGGTGKCVGDRHPKVRSGVMIGAGAKILGNIEIGRNAKIGASSVVVKPVDPDTTVTGVPAKPHARPSFQSQPRQGEAASPTLARLDRV